MRYSLSNDTWGQEEMEAAKKVLDSKLFSMGQNVKEFERRFALEMGASYAVMSNSGSSANLLAVSALVLSGRLQKGDEVLVTAVSWSTTYFPLSQCGLKIRFVDIDPNTLNVDMDKLEKAITKKTKAVMAVNLLGNPNDFDRLEKICRENDLLLIEDNCESMGAEYNGKKAGSFGIAGTFSSYYSHHICTMEGGMTVTDDEELYHYMLSIRSHGWTRHLPSGSSIYKKRENDFYESFHFIMPGYNLRPLEIEAAVGLEQLYKLNSLIKQRRENAEYFKSKIKEIPDIRYQKETGMSSWFGFALVLEGKKAGKREQFIEAFQRNQIEVRPIVAGNFTKQKALEFMDYSIFGSLENADIIHENGFFVGNYSVPMKEEIELLIKTLCEVK